MLYVKIDNGDNLPTFAPVEEDYNIYMCCDICGAMIPVKDGMKILQNRAIHPGHMDACENCMSELLEEVEHERV